MSATKNVCQIPASPASAEKCRSAHLHSPNRRDYPRCIPRNESRLDPKEIHLGAHSHPALRIRNRFGQSLPPPLLNPVLCATKHSPLIVCEPRRWPSKLHQTLFGSKDKW